MSCSAREGLKIKETYSTRSCSGEIFGNNSRTFFILSMKILNIKLGIFIRRKFICTRSDDCRLYGKSEIELNAGLDAKKQ